MPFPDKCVIIANPAAGRGKAYHKLMYLQEVLDAHHLSYVVKVTNAPYHATELAQQAVKEEFELVVAFGGDGTINEVASGLINTRTALGVIPCGTGNDFIRSLGIPVNIVRAVKILSEYYRDLIDVGQLNGRYFINGLGIGFDARVNYEATRIKRLRGHALYIIALLKTLRLYQSIEMEIRYKGIRMQRNTYLIALGNGFSVGGGFRLTPDARLDDSLFDVCHVSDVGLGTIVRHFPKLFNGRINVVDQVTMARVPEIHIESDQEMPVHLDGEVYSMTSHAVTASILPRALHVVMNKKSTHYPAA